ncbi:hypothetical protein [Streptomyces sp. SID3343]|uniref:hypothetical protein n=1 Tax=Streptomyces sp. SID3343 TaxID=2690260 RepID=UPI0013704C67|nr:hypothetical protein [Streptomyces sp. SID3343]MYW04182.1 hypothetical protein [Streptomyces sp. SID3343]
MSARVLAPEGAAFSLSNVDRSVVCPCCGTRAPGWVRVRVDSLRVWTHDGNVICPRDPSFGRRSR